MIQQTIALFRYLMLGIVSRRLFVLLALVMLLALLGGGFVHELTIINGDVIVAAFIADFLRYCLVLLTLLLVTTAVAEDFQSRQFERLLTMPLARWQYIAAQALVIACLCLLLVLPALLLISFYGGPALGAYWAGALWLELLLLGLLGLLAILSLEKVPLAVLFSLSIYLLAKLSGLITLMLAESVRLSDASAGSRALELVFGAILYVIPGPASFAQNNVFFGPADLLARFGDQLAAVSIYTLFLLAASLVDFYRKEFSI